MKILLPCAGGQRVLRSFAVWAAVAGLGLLGALGLGGVAAVAETHAHLQSVTPAGTSAWGGTTPFTVVGVLLTDPEEMLDGTPNFIPYRGSADMFRMGGEWHVVVQAALAGDRGGTTCWMGQNYGNHPSHLGEEFSYSNEAWSAEVARLNRDPVTGHIFRKGDLVSVAANRSLFYGGKRNINEAHDAAPAADFTMSLVISNYGLPSPEVLSLASLMREDDGDSATSEDMFDATRASGGEHWQGMRVRLIGLRMVDASGWDSTRPWGERFCRVTDGEGRLFRLRHPRQDLGPAPVDPFDVIGVLTQESGASNQGTNGYELFVQQVLPASEPVVEILSPRVVVTWPGELSNYRLLSAPEAGGEYLPVEVTPVVWGNRRAVILDPAEARARIYQLERTR